MLFILKILILLYYMSIHHSFRSNHLLGLLEGYENQQHPLDLFISKYFRAHKALGSKDRGVIAETIYSLVRWKGLVDHICEKPLTWEKRLKVFTEWDLESLQNQQDIPNHIKVSFPKILFDKIVDTHGLEKACELCFISNSPAPTTIRINPLKTTRDEMLSRWNSTYSISPCQHSPYGITFHKKFNFFSLEEFKKGLFEVQDEGSQLLADLVNAQPGQQVMDYCAGSGGKTLAFAHKMKGKGQIYLHDIRPFALQESVKRLRRAGIQNAQTIQADSPQLKKLKKRMDWVLVDAPCSGTGTIRRNPDMKWKFMEETLERLIGQQRTIFEKALSYMKPEGRIIYATCSLLKEENCEQVAHFLQTYNLEIEGQVFETLPEKGKMDGFYGVILKKK